MLVTKGILRQLMIDLEGFSSDTTFCDTSWVPPVNIFARPFGNCWLPLWFWPLLFPQLLNFVLTVHVFNLSIFMAHVPLPLLISGQSSSLRLSTMEEAPMNKEMIAEAPDATTFTLYIPDFLREYSLSEQSVEEQKNELLRRNWLTSGLIHEIHSLYPTCSEIKTDDDNKRDPTAFEHKISQLFPPGRIFASFKQLDQATDMRCVGHQEDQSLQKHPVRIFRNP
jgi:hypothetical protein